MTTDKPSNAPQDSPPESGSATASGGAGSPVVGHLKRVVITAWPFVAPFTGLLVVVVIFAVFYPTIYPRVHTTLPAAYQLKVPRKPFLTQDRIPLIAKQTAIVAMGALGMTVIIIAGGIDLSAGSLLALNAVSLAALLRAGVPPPLALALLLLIGTAAGAANGLLITSLRLVPFIVTLGTMLIFRGMAHWISNQQKIHAVGPDWMTTLLDRPESGWQLVSTGVWLVVLLGIVVAGMLRYTVFGRYVFALGSNEATARLCGVNVPLTKIAVYSVGGLFMAVAGLLDYNNMNMQADPQTGIALELDIIAAVVIGGGSLAGGRGSVLGSIVGALTMTTLYSGCTYAGVSDPIQRMIVGSVIIAAVAIDQWVHRGNK